MATTATLLLLIATLAGSAQAAASAPPHVAARLEAFAAARAGPLTGSRLRDDDDDDGDDGGRPGGVIVAPVLSLAPADSAAAFGWAVASSGDGQTVFATAVASSAAGGCGAVYVFAGGNQSQLLTEPGAACSPGSGFGWSVAVSADGSTLAVGAPQAQSANGQWAGAVHVFARAAAGAPYAFAQTLSPSDGVGGDAFGWALSASADGAAVAVGATGSGFVGKAYVFAAVGPRLEQLQMVDAEGGAPGDCFGGAVALSADALTLAVGAGGAAGAGGAQGAAFVYARAPSVSPAVFGLVAQLSLGAAGAAGDLFGFALALSSDGALLAVGAPGAPAGAKAGAVYAFAAAGATTDPQAWSGAPAAVYAGAAGAEAGYALALSPDAAPLAALAAGAPFAAPNGTGGGAALANAAAATPADANSLSAASAPAGAQAGWSVASSGGGLVVVLGSVGAGAVLVYSAPGSASLTSDATTAFDATLLGLGAGVAGATILAVVAYIACSSGGGGGGGAAAEEPKKGAKRPAKRAAAGPAGAQEVMLSTVVSVGAPAKSTEAGSYSAPQAPPAPAAQKPAQKPFSI